MRDKKLILLIVLAGLALLSLLYGILTPSRLRRPGSPEAVTTQSTKPGASNLLAPLERSARKSSYLGWGRNPFSLSEVATVEKPVLNGIVWDQKSPQAIINNQILQKGDRIGRFTITDIQSTSVILTDDTHILELRLGRKRP